MKAQYVGSNLKITLGNANLDLPQEKQDKLRQDLVKQLGSIFADTENTPEMLQAKLDKMQFIFNLWNWLEDEDFLRILHSIQTEKLIPLLRYIKQQNVSLLKRIHTFFDETSEEDIKQQIAEMDKIPALEIINILQNIYSLLQELLGEGTPNMPPDNFDENASLTRFEDISAYVKALPSVPPDRARVILENLSYIQKVKLSRIAKVRKWNDFADWFANMETHAFVSKMEADIKRMPPQPLWEEMQILEAVYNMMAPGGTVSNKKEAEFELNISDALSKKVQDFLHQLGKISINNLQLVLKSLNKEDLASLLAVVEELKLTNLHDGIHGAIPAKLYEELQNSKPTSLDSQELQKLLVTINSTIKKLKQGNA